MPVLPMMVSHRVEGHTRCADSPSKPLPWVNPNPIVDRADGPLTGSGSYSHSWPSAVGGHRQLPSIALNHASAAGVSAVDGVP